MRWRVHLAVVLAWTLTVPVSLAHASHQTDYLEIYLKLNTAENLVKQGDYRGAMADFQDCYLGFAKIHDADPNWEAALVMGRMNDCKRMILLLKPQADAQPPTTTNILPAGTNGTQPTPPSSEPATNPDEVPALKLELRAVQEELRITKDHLKDSEALVETYRTQLELVNQKLAAAKNQQSANDGMGKLLNENKALTGKLAEAQKEIDDFRTNPKSKLALAQAQLKNLQDQYDATLAANKALEGTTTTLKDQLDQAQNDLVIANQKLAASPAGSPEYATIKRENEIMRDILTRELQEQAHRDMAKRLAQEEFENLKLKSKVLQEQLDILGTPMTPPSNDQERELLASLRVTSPDVAPGPGQNSFSASVAAAPTTDINNSTSVAPPVSAAPDATQTNTASVTPPATNSVAESTPSPADPTNQPPVAAVNNLATPEATNTEASPLPATNVVATTPATNTLAAADPPPPSDPGSDPATSASVPSVPTNVPDSNAPLPPNVPPGPSVSNAVATPTPPPPTTTPDVPPTTTKLPPAETTQSTTTIQNGGVAKQDDPTQYSTRARLPDDMRDTAQEAADLFKNQQYDESAAKYQTIIEKYPESLYAWSNLGVVRFQQGKFNEALKALQQAVKLSPTDAFSYSNLGIVYYQLNQYENAISALNSAEALDPNDAKTHNYLGCACSQKGWQEVAEKEFHKAIDIDPNFGDAHFNLSLVYATSKPPALEMARREYNRALELGIAKDPRLEKLLQPQ
jgi:Flp pilus assembly protein TadD